MTQRAVADDDDPPSRVARLAYTEGAVSFQPAGTDDWVSAVVNRPMTTGDKLWSDDGSLAELHIGSASIRLSGNTGFSFLNLTDDVAQLRLTAGTLRIRVKRLGDNETFEVDTPNLAFSILRPGTYKLNVNDDGDATMIVVRRGEGEVTGGGAAYTVHPHEVGYFTGTDELNADVQDYNDGDDEFDRWCLDRDRREDVSVSARYVSPDVIGYEDLDQYGGWRPVPEYGTVWFPRTTIVGWAPYHYGHWAYVYPWGYTWVDDAPWGFAPFHYGRWVFVGGAWGWVPAPPPVRGAVYVRPVYAPALVAWVGGPHFGVGVAVGGNVGWFPLGPREVYVPSYPVSRTYVTNVNVSNTTVNTTVVNNYYNTTVVNKNVTNVTVVHQTFINQSVPGAVTATTPQAFTSAQSVSRNIVRVDQREVVRAPVNVVTPAIAPPRQAVLGTGTAAVARPPAFAQNRAVVAKMPPPPPPVSFARQQEAIQANGGRPLAISQARQLQPQNAPTVHPYVKIAPQANQQNNGGNAHGPMQPGGPAGQGSNAASGGGNAGSQGGQGYRGFNGRPPSAQNGVGNGSGQNQNNGGSVQGSNAGQPNGGNAGGQGNQDRRGFNDRPASAQPSVGNGSGQNQNNGRSVQGSNAGQPNGGNAGGQGNQDRRGFNDRPASAQPSVGNGSGQNQNNGGSVQGSNAGQPNGGGRAGGQGNQGYRGFNDRPPSTQTGMGNSSSPNQSNSRSVQGGNAGQSSAGGNAGGQGNQGSRALNDHPPASRPSAGATSNGNGGADARHQQQPEPVHAQQNQQQHQGQQQQPQPKQERKAQDSKAEKDDHNKNK
jgi:hypothetical protein